MKTIRIHDPLYGSLAIAEPVLIELIRSRAVKRLKKVGQFGIPNRYSHRKSFSRYDHSIGVMLLIRKLGGSLEEQVAGLLHDVSHAAFSHLIDWVVGEGGDETYQDNRHEKVLNSRDIRNILRKYRYDPKMISDYHRFRLLEREIPDLCADRVDYALRELPRKLAKFLVLSLANVKDEIIFVDKRAAYLFASNFLRLQKESWGSAETCARYILLSGALRHALKQEILIFDDFFTDDERVINKLLKKEDEKIRSILKMLRQKKLSLSGRKQPIMKKFRYTDPKFMEAGRLKRVSETSPRFKRFLNKEIYRSKKGVMVPTRFLAVW